MRDGRRDSGNAPTLRDERPSQFAERLAESLSSRIPADDRKRHGVFFTPVAVAEFMASLISGPLAGHVAIVDPGAGLGILSCAACERIASRFPSVSSISIHAYETEDSLKPGLEEVMAYATKYLARRGVSLAPEVRTTDFVLSHSEMLVAAGQMLPLNSEKRGYDLAISNPPYFKLSASDERALAAKAVVHGQPNVYSLFMAAAASLLRERGQLIFITPRSFASGTYFRRFREWFFDLMVPEQIHLFVSRRQAFRRDDVLQENVIMATRRSTGWRTESCERELSISSSHGPSDLSRARPRSVAISSVLDLRDRGSVLRIPTSERDDAVTRLVQTWQGSFAEYGLEISTGPVVPFRAVALLDSKGDVPTSHYPLLWMHHVSPMRMDWPNGTRKQQFIKATKEAERILIENQNYVLLRRFSAKEERRRLVAAPLVAGTLESPMLGLENHLNYIHRPGGTLTDEETWGLAALLSSSLLDIYIRTVSGNTQVNASDLRAIPLPDREKILAIGRIVRASPKPSAAVDRTVRETLDVRIAT